jgi:hypothetical protein
MTYVWITETDGKKRYVNDIYLNPCRKCGERVSVCRETTKCEEKAEHLDVMCIFCSDAGCEVCEQRGCQACNSDRGCRCDAIEDERTGN